MDKWLALVAPAAGDAPRHRRLGASSPASRLIWFRVWQVKHPTWDLYGGTHYLRPSFAGVRASMAAGPDLRRLCQRHFSWSRDMELHEGVGVDHGEERRGSSDQGEERRGSSSSSSLEIVGPVRRNVAVAAKAIQTLESSRVEGGKLDGCLGAPISALLATALGGCGDGVSGVFEAEDGARSDPIEMSELVQGSLSPSPSPNPSHNPSALAPTPQP